MSEIDSAWPHTDSVAGRRLAKRRWTRWDKPRVDILKVLWSDRKLTIAMIADIMETTPGSVGQQAAKHGLPPRNGRAKKAKQRFAGFKGDRQTDGEGLRRFQGYSKHDGGRVVLPDWHPALREGATIYPTTVMPASHVDRLLKSGHNSPKIGKQMTKGRWKGMPVFTLTLEERETCPRTCLQWSTCYGNNMHMAHRIHDDGSLVLRLTSELLHLAFCYPDGFVVRLHVLGDFYSVAYVEFWRTMLERFKNLRIFGFTARLPQDPIGRAVLELMRDHYDRVSMRVSGGGLETDCAEVIDTAEEATGIRCPAETDPERCCANCGLCMQTNRTISFVRH